MCYSVGGANGEYPQNLLFLLFRGEKRPLNGKVQNLAPIYSHSAQKFTFSCQLVW